MVSVQTLICSNSIAKPQNNPAISSLLDAEQDWWGSWEWCQQGINSFGASFASGRFWCCLPPPAARWVKKSSKSSNRQKLLGKWKGKYGSRELRVTRRVMIIKTGRCGWQLGEDAGTAHAGGCFSPIGMPLRSQMVVLSKKKTMAFSQNFDRSFACVLSVFLTSFKDNELLWLFLLLCRITKAVKFQFELFLCRAVSHEVQS